MKAQKVIQEAIKKIEKNQWIEELQRCQSVKERFDKLMKLLPEIWLWDPISARQLVFQLYQKYGLDFGICPFYKIEDDRQYCTVDGKKVECLCAIPEPYCSWRGDKDGQPKYPEFLYIRILEAMEH